MRYEEGSWGSPKGSGPGETGADLESGVGIDTGGAQREVESEALFQLPDGAREPRHDRCGAKLAFDEGLHGGTNRPLARAFEDGAAEEVEVSRTRQRDFAVHV